ncbi:MAG: alkaline phosphatase family protein [Acidobacteria bacterium]|nr:alkaline phosphatase family protein [Acidobacteriota bacterium]
MRRPAASARWVWVPLLLVAGSGAQAAERRRALIIDIDGVRRDTFEQAYQAGTLPNFQRILGGALWYDRAESVLPTVTMAAQSSIFTGSAPAWHGIPGNSWFDRTTGRLYDYVSAGTAPCLYAFTLFGGGECREGLLNRHLLAGTLYEAAATAGLTSAVVFHPVWRGATRAVLPSLTDGLTLLDGNGLNFEAFDRMMAQRAANFVAFEERTDILTVYFTGADEIAHGHGIAAQPPYLATVVDPLVGRLADALDARDRDWLASAMIVVTSDHGRTDAAANPEDRTLSRDLAAALGRAGFAEGQFRVAANGGMAYVYLKNGEEWEAMPAPETVDAVRREILADPLLAKLVLEIRVRQSSDSARWGDLSVFLKPSHYFGNTGAGSHHGNADILDLSVPLVVVRPGGPAGHTSLEARITQVAGTVAEYLGFPLGGAEPALPVPPT